MAHQLIGNSAMDTLPRSGSRTSGAIPERSSTFSKQIRGFWMASLYSCWLGQDILLEPEDEPESENRNGAWLHRSNQGPGVT